MTLGGVMSTGALVSVVKFQVVLSVIPAKVLLAMSLKAPASMSIWIVAPSVKLFEGLILTCLSVIVTKLLLAANNATEVAINSNLLLTFDEPILKGTTGSITIYQDNTLLQTIEITNAAASITDKVLTIDPPQDLPEGVLVNVRITAEAIADTAGNAFAGILDNTTWQFTTATDQPEDQTPPIVVSFSPTDEATEVAIDTDLVLTFDEAVTKGSGNITITAGTVVQTINVTDAAVSVNANTVTINPADLPYSSQVSVQMAAGAIVDTAGNSFDGITDNTTWNFSTLAQPDNTAPTVLTYTPANALPAMSVIASVDICTLTDTPAGKS